MLTLASIILILSVILTLLRILFTQVEADKVIAIDIMSFELMALSVILAFHDNNSLPLQFAFAISLLGFISTLILSRIFKSNPMPS